MEQKEPTLSEMHPSVVSPYDDHATKSCGYCHIRHKWLPQGTLEPYVRTSDNENTTHVAPRDRPERSHLAPRTPHNFEDYDRTNIPRMPGSEWTSPQPLQTYWPARPVLPLDLPTTSPRHPPKPRVLSLQSSYSMKPLPMPDFYSAGKEHCALYR